MYRAIATLLLILLSQTGAFAQAVAGFGGVSGVVRDSTGAVVVNAKVDVVNESKGIKRTLTTNDAGVFNAPALVPATGYQVTVSNQGFKSYEVKNIEILVGQNISLNVTLDVASATTTVEVLDQAPIVESTRTGNSAVVNSRLIANLPINGRRVDSFVLMAPAVVADGTFGLVSFRGIAGGNSFLTDGNDTTNQYYNENAGRTRISTQISQDAVQEFEVLSNGYSAEYGRASGGVINTVTRSGGNDIHGTGYWFFRNQDFNARDRYAVLVPKETRAQYGGSIGGSIKKDKLFYFFNTEIIRRNYPLDASMKSSNLFDGNGNFIAACAAPATPAQCEAAKTYITSRHFQEVPRKANSELGFGKIDWRPTERNSFSFSMNYLRWISPNGIQTAAALTNGGGIGNNGDSTVRTRYGRVSWTAIPTATMVNELRYGWFKDRLFDDLNPEYFPAATGRLALTIQGQANVGVANYMPRLNPSEQRHQIADNVTWTIGKHTLKLGGDISNTQDYSKQLFNGRGSYTYATFQNFALDFSGNTTGAKRWQTYSQGFGNDVIDTNIRDYSLYVQDQFRATKNLTVNFGLRYEYSQFKQPGIVNPDYPTQTGHIRQPGKNFAPRIGIAYALNDNKTVIRAGYGIFYARFPGGLINTFTQANGVYQKNVSLQNNVPADLALGPVFPSVLPNLDRNPPAGAIGLTFPSSDFRNPYTQQGDIGVQRELRRNLGLDISYIWSRGVGLFTARDLNLGPFGAPVTYRINDASGAQAGSYTTDTYRLANRVDTRWQRLNQVDNGGNSYYNAMVALLKQRLTKGHEFQISYTWSHAIDYNQGGGNDNIFYSSGPRSLYNGDYKYDKSSSSLDQRHRFSFGSIHQPNFVKSDTKAAKFLINNWQLSQISTFASTQPQTPTVFVTGSGFSGAAFTGSLTGMGGSSRVPFLPAASIDVDRIIRTDARLTKILPFTERYQAMINFEVFNLFNNVSNTGINAQAYTVANGVFTPFRGYRQPTASGGFPDGTNARRAQVSARFVF